jgi:hypothetical protein
MTRGTPEWSPSRARAPAVLLCGFMAAGSLGCPHDDAGYDPGRSATSSEGSTGRRTAPHATGP